MMFTKTFIAVALVVPALALSSTAFAGGTYQGGPKSGLWTNSPTVETNKPYAEIVSPTSNRQIYQGGPHGR
jgi:hypothetical protein